MELLSVGETRRCMGRERTRVGAAVGARVPAPSLPVHVTARAAQPHRHILMTDLVLHGELWTTHALAGAREG